MEASTVGSSWGILGGPECVSCLETDKDASRIHGLFIRSSPLLPCTSTTFIKRIIQFGVFCFVWFCCLQNINRHLKAGHAAHPSTCGEWEDCALRDCLLPSPPQPPILSHILHSYSSSTWVVFPSPKPRPLQGAPCTLQAAAFQPCIYFSSRIR